MYLVPWIEEDVLVFRNIEVYRANEDSYTEENKVCKHCNTLPDYVTPPSYDELLSHSLGTRLTEQIMELVVFSYESAFFFVWIFLLVLSQSPFNVK